MQVRRGAVIAAVAVLLAAAAIGVVVVVNKDSGTPAAECVIPAPPAGGSGDTAGAEPLTDQEFSAAQLQNAATISAVGIARDLPLRARIIAIATALQESTLRNLDYGDRDSVGLFQQRPSQGWGTVEQIMDPVYSAGKFYDELVTVPNWRTDPLTEVAQAVQRSAFPDAYAKWEDEATVLAAAFAGTSAPELRCRPDAAAPTAAQPTREPLSGTQNANGRLRALLAAAHAELGAGAADVTVRSVGSAGRSAVVTFTGGGLSAGTGNRMLAAWMVAHSTGTGVQDITVDGRRYRGGSWSGPDSGNPPAGAAARDAVTVTVG
ncbi:hypothetical protein [Nakamurella aerolata]|uniref:hypothetical protein n=1 Tax=Nakamurella aerolata TaxID=1656892 RepID=UPI001BB141A9|nr:hypothetical protein [Nakamurella aerolata]